MKAATTAAIACLLALSGAALPQTKGAPWSELTGELYTRTEPNRAPAIIKQVDGRQDLNKVVRAEPGKRTVIVQSPARKGMSGSDARLELQLEPCKRYFVNAQFKSGVGSDWTPVVAGVDTVPGCKAP